jgi:hypothetical protein
MSMNPYIYQELVRPALPFATSSLLLLRTAKKKRGNYLQIHISVEL